MDNIQCNILSSPNLPTPVGFMKAEGNTRVTMGDLWRPNKINIHTLTLLNPMFNNGSILESSFSVVLQEN
jgi:hypothetical protein